MDNSQWWLVLAALGGGVFTFLSQFILQFVLAHSHLYVRRVLPGQAGVLIREGKSSRVLTPGLYWYFPGRNLVEVIDTCVEVHESDWTPVLTSDGKNLTVKWKLKCQVSDPIKALFHVWDVREALTDEVGSAVFASLSKRTLDQCAKHYEEVTDELDEVVVKAAKSVGYQVLGFAFTGMSRARPLHLIKDNYDTTTE